MEKHHNLLRYTKISALMPIALTLFLITAYFQPHIDTENTTASVFNIVIIYGLPLAMLAGSISYILWFYQSYKLIYKRAKHTNFSPFIATVLSHTPLFCYVALPISIKELWIHSSSKPIPRIISHFTIWWMISILGILSLLLNHQSILSAYWSCSIAISSLWLYLISIQISKHQIELLNSENTNTPITEP